MKKSYLLSERIRRLLSILVVMLFCVSGANAKIVSKVQQSYDHNGTSHWETVGVNTTNGQYFVVLVVGQQNICIDGYKYGDTQREKGSMYTDVTSNGGFNSNMKWLDENQVANTQNEGDKWLAFKPNGDVAQYGIWFRSWNNNGDKADFVFLVVDVEGKTGDEAKAVIENDVKNWNPTPGVNITPKNGKVAPDGKQVFTVTSEPEIEGATWKWETSNDNSSWNEVENVTGATYETPAIAEGETLYVRVTLMNAPDDYEGETTVTAQVTAQAYTCLEKVAGPFYINNYYKDENDGKFQEYLVDEGDGYLKGTKNPTTLETKHQWMLWKGTGENSQYYYLQNVATGNFIDAQKNWDGDNYFSSDGDYNRMSVSAFDCASESKHRLTISDIPLNGCDKPIDVNKVMIAEQGHDKYKGRVLTDTWDSNRKDSEYKNIDLVYIYVTNRSQGDIRYWNFAQVNKVETQELKLEASSKLAVVDGDVTITATGFGTENVKWEYSTDVVTWTAINATDEGVIIEGNNHEELTYIVKVPTYFRASTESGDVRSCENVFVNILNKEIEACETGKPIVLYYEPFDLNRTSGDLSVYQQSWDGMSKGYDFAAGCITNGKYAVVNNPGNGFHGRDGYFPDCAENEKNRTWFIDDYDHTGNKNGAGNRVGGMLAVNFSKNSEGNILEKVYELPTGANITLAFYEAPITRENGTDKADFTVYIEQCATKDGTYTELKKEKFSIGMKHGSSLSWTSHTVSATNTEEWVKVRIRGDKSSGDNGSDIAFDDIMILACLPELNWAKENKPFNDDENEVMLQCDVESWTGAFGNDGPWLQVTEIVNQTTGKSMYVKAWFVNDQKEGSSYGSDTYSDDGLPLIHLKDKCSDGACIHIPLDKNNVFDKAGNAVSDQIFVEGNAHIVTAYLFPNQGTFEDWNAGTISQKTASYAKSSPVNFRPNPPLEMHTCKLESGTDYTEEVAEFLQQSKYPTYLTALYTKIEIYQKEDLEPDSYKPIEGKTPIAIYARKDDGKISYEQGQDKQFELADADDLSRNYVSIFYSNESGEEKAVESQPFVLNINENPANQMIVTPDGLAYCANDEDGNANDGVEIKLGGSEKDVEYQLYKGDIEDDKNKVGAPQDGTGQAIDFGKQKSGTYTIVATNPTTGCKTTMNGKIAVTITENANPTITLTPTPNTNCVPFNGKVTLTTNGTNYSTDKTSWESVGSFETDPKFNDIESLAATTVYVKDANGCMNRESVTVADNSRELQQFTLSAPANATVCENEKPNSFTLTLSGSETGVTYQLYKGEIKDGNAVGESKDGTGSELTWPVTEAGEYRVKAENSTTGCEADMTGSAQITIVENPANQTIVTPDGLAYCANDEDGNANDGVEIKLGGSEKDVEYQLYKGDIEDDRNKVGDSQDGTGQAIDFGKQKSGTYTIVATNPTTGCKTTMNGKTAVTITENANPEFTIKSEGIEENKICSGIGATRGKLSAELTETAKKNFGADDVKYQWSITAGDGTKVTLFDDDKKETGTAYDAEASEKLLQKRDIYFTISDAQSGAYTFKCVVTSADAEKGNCPVNQTITITAKDCGVITMSAKNVPSCAFVDLSGLKDISSSQTNEKGILLSPKFTLTNGKDADVKNLVVKFTVPTEEIGTKLVAWNDKGTTIEEPGRPIKVFADNKEKEGVKISASGTDNAEITVTLPEDVMIPKNDGELSVQLGFYLKEDNETWEWETDSNTPKPKLMGMSAQLVGMGDSPESAVVAMDIKANAAAELNHTPISEDLKVEFIAPKCWDGEPKIKVSVGDGNLYNFDWTKYTQDEGGSYLDEAGNQIKGGVGFTPEKECENCPPCIVPAGPGSISDPNNPGQNKNVTYSYDVKISCNNGCETNLSDLHIGPGDVEIPTEPRVKSAAKSATCDDYGKSQEVKFEKEDGTGTGNFKYNLQNVEGWDENNQTLTLPADYENDGTKKVTVNITDENNCSTSQDVSLPEHYKNFEANLDESLTSNPSCAGRSDGKISFSVSGGAGGYKYSMTDATGNEFVPSVNDNVVTFENLPDGDYTVSVTDKNNCPANPLNSKMKGKEPEKLSIKEPAAVCEGGKATLNAVGPENLAYKWEYTDDNGATWTTLIGNGSTISVDAVAGRQYKVSAPDAKCVSPCENTDVDVRKKLADLEIVAEYADGCERDSREPLRAMAGRKVLLTAKTSASPSEYRWSDGVTTTENVREVVVGTAQTYQVTVSDGICPDAKAAQTIESVWPTIFTPFTADGENDQFLENDPSKCKFREGWKIIIFNRYGQKVYEGPCGWDGKYREKMADPGAYYYSVTLPDGSTHKGALEVSKKD